MSIKRCTHTGIFRLCVGLSARTSRLFTEQAN